MDGVDLHVPLSEHTQNMLFKQVPALLELPKFNANDDGISKVERVREWKCAVNDKLAALSPVFKEYWQWSWAVADEFYRHWLTLNARARGLMGVTAPVPQRYVWLEDLFREKIVKCLPQKQQSEYYGEAHPDCQAWSGTCRAW